MISKSVLIYPVHDCDVLQNPVSSFETYAGIERMRNAYLGAWSGRMEKGG